MRRAVASRSRCWRRAGPSRCGCRPASDDRVNDLYVYRSFARAACSTGSCPTATCSSSTRRSRRRRSRSRACVGTGEETFRSRSPRWMLLAAAAVVLLCGALAARTGGDPRRAMLAAALTPLLVGAMVRTHFDLVPVALLLGALLLAGGRAAAAGHRRARPGGDDEGLPDRGGAAGAGLARCRDGRREALRAAAALAVTVAVIGHGGGGRLPGGPRDASRYQTDRPVQIESTPATRALRARRPRPRRRGAAWRATARTAWRIRRRAPSARSCSRGHAALVAVLALLGRARGRPTPRALVLACAGRGGGVRAARQGALAAVPGLVVPLGALAFAWRMHALAAGGGAGRGADPARVSRALLRPASTASRCAVALVCLRNAALLAVLGTRRAGATAARAGAAARSRVAPRPRRPPRLARR